MTKWPNQSSTIFSSSKEDDNNTDCVSNENHEGDDVIYRDVDLQPI